MKKERVKKGRGRELEEIIGLECRRRREGGSWTKQCTVKKIKVIYDVKDFLNFRGLCPLTPAGG